MATGTNKEQRQHPPAPTGHLPWSKAFQLYSEPSTSVPSREECDLFISEGRADGYPQLEEIERWQSSRAEPDRHFHTDRARWQQAEPANVTSARSCSATFIPSWPADASNSGDFPDDMAVEGLNSAALDLLSTWDNQQSAISKQAGSTSMALQPSNAARLKLSSTASTATAEEATCSFEDFHSSSQQYRQQQNPFVRADLDMPQRKQQATVLPTKQNSKVGVKPLKKLQPAKKITRPAQVIHAAAKKRQKTTKTHFPFGSAGNAAAASSNSQQPRRKPQRLPPYNFYSEGGTELDNASLGLEGHTGNGLNWEGVGCATFQQ